MLALNKRSGNLSVNDSTNIQYVTSNTIKTVLVCLCTFLGLLYYFTLGSGQIEDEYFISSLQEQQRHRKLCSAKYVDFAQSLVPLSDTDKRGFF